MVSGVCLDRAEDVLGRGPEREETGLQTALSGPAPALLFFREQTRPADAATRGSAAVVERSSDGCGEEDQQAEAVWGECRRERADVKEPSGLEVIQGECAKSRDWLPSFLSPGLCNFSPMDLSSGSCADSSSVPTCPSLTPSLSKYPRHLTLHHLPSILHLASVSPTGPSTWPSGSPPAPPPDHWGLPQPLHLTIGILPQDPLPETSFLQHTVTTSNSSVFTVCSGTLHPIAWAIPSLDCHAESSRFSSELLSLWSMMTSQLSKPV